MLSANNPVKQAGVLGSVAKYPKLTLRHSGAAFTPPTPTMRRWKSPGTAYRKLPRYQM